MSWIPLPYCLLLIILFILAYCEHKLDSDQRKWPRAITFTLLLFFFGLRGFIMDDWIVYFVHFTESDFSMFSTGENITSNDINMEPFYSLFVVCFKFISKDYFVFQFFCTLLQLILLFRFFSQYIHNYTFGCILFLAFGGLIMVTNLIRNTFAILIFANCIQYILERKFLPYILGCAIAALFHTSALLFIPLYFFIHFSLSKKTFAIITISACVFFIIQGQLLSFISNYLADLDYVFAQKVYIYIQDESAESSMLSLGFIERVATMFIIWFFYDKLTTQHKSATIFINITLIYFCIQCLLRENRLLADRFAFLFAMGYWILWTYIPKLFEAKYNRNITYFAICIYAILKMIVYTNKPVAKYENVLFGIQSYDEREVIHQEYQDKTYQNN